jgi:magnesium chelatase accessory protein
MSVVQRESLHDWPLSEFSQFVRVGCMQWHVQILGEGPVMCLLHGTGSSTHSWRALAQRLSSHYRVVMCDLPGHRFTALPDDANMSLIGMSNSIALLLSELDIQPDFIVGHSAGAAIACQMVLDQHTVPQCVISINGALVPFRGLAGQLFSPLAQLMASSSMIPSLVRWRAVEGDITSRLINDTGSVIDDEGRQYYQRLLSDKKHVSGALKMMAHWNLHEFAHRLPSMHIPLHLVIGLMDKTVPPSQCTQLNTRLAFSTLTELPALGHLAHEEAPMLFDALLRERAQPGTAAPEQFKTTIQTRDFQS